MKKTFHKTKQLFKILMVSNKNGFPVITYFMPQGHKARTWVMPQGSNSVITCRIDLKLGGNMSSDLAGKMHFDS